MSRLHLLYDNFKDAILRHDELAAESLISDPALPVNGFQSQGDDKALIFWTIDNDQKNIMQMLLKREDCAVNILDGNYGRTPLYAVCEQGRCDFVEVLLTHPNIKVNIGNFNENSSPLMIALELHHNECVKALLKSEYIDVNYAGIEGFNHLPDQFNYPPLIIATQHENIKGVELMVQDPRTDVNIMDVTGYTALCIAAKNLNELIVDILLKHPAIDVNKTNADNGFMPLIHAILETIRQGSKGYITVATLLSHHEIDPNQQPDLHGVTCLYVAVREHELICVQLLLNHPNILPALSNTDDDEFPLFTAAEQNHPAIMKELLKHDLIQVNQKNSENGMTALISAAALENITCLELLLAHPDIDVNLGLDYDQTLLYVTVLHGAYESVKILLQDMRTKINQPTLHGETALMVAARQGVNEIVELLLTDTFAGLLYPGAYMTWHLANSAIPSPNSAIAPGLLSNYIFSFLRPRTDVNKTINSDLSSLPAELVENSVPGASALWMAAANGHADCVDSLLEHEYIDAKLPDRQGRTPLNIATTNGYADCKTLLEDFISGRRIPKAKRL
jgi:ankyrin repeat protein